MKECILCHKPTTGSVGAAGIKWDCICQPCKDKEDEALAKVWESSMEVQMKFMASVFSAFNSIQKEDK